MNFSGILYSNNGAISGQPNKVSVQRRGMVEYDFWCRNVTIRAQSKQKFYSQ